MDLRPDLVVDLGALAMWCQRSQIVRLSVFGSALRDDFTESSDIDLLVEFEPGATPGLFAIARFELELSELFGGREIELRTAEDLSRHFRDDVRRTARVLHRAA